VDRKPKKVSHFQKKNTLKNLVKRKGEFLKLFRIFFSKFFFFLKLFYEFFFSNIFKKM